MVDGAVAWARHPEWEDGVTSIGLRLKRVRIKGRCVVLHIEGVQPIEITQHEPRPESRCAPFTRVAVDLCRASFEPAVRGKEMAIMFKIVYPDLESSGGEFLS